MNLDSTLLKTDGRGRVRTPEAQWEALLDEFERSGLSGMRFAALHGVKYPSFANWVQRHRRERGAGGGAPLSSGSTSTNAPVRVAQDFDFFCLGEKYFSTVLFYGRRGKKGKTVKSRAKLGCA